jgi:adenylate cyclase
MNNLDACIEFYDPKKHFDLKYEYAEDPAVASYIMRSLCLYNLGFSDQAVEASNQAVRLADQVSHANTSGIALGFVPWLHHFLGDPRAVLATAEKAMAFAKDAGLPMWYAGSRIFRGWALSRLGSADEGIDETRRGIDGWRAAGAEGAMSCMHAVLGDAYYLAGRHDDALREIEEGIRFVEDRQEGFRKAELYRLKGEVLLDQNADHIAEAEECFGQALEIAHDQSAKSLELRAATSLARLWAGRGERHRAHDLLAPVYSWFTEGFGTRDLIEAKALLDHLA